jgi:hypothetical protein
VTQDFLVYWHRAGNSLAGLDAVARARRTLSVLDGRPVRHGVECDLKWTGSPPHLYLYHGPTGLERLSLVEARRREAAGEIVSLEAALDRPDAGEIDYMVEVKRGHGERRAAIAACVDAFVRRGLGDRLLLAASSLGVLEELRADHGANVNERSLKLSLALFVTHIFGDGRVLHVPKIGIWSGLRRGIVLGPEKLAAVDLVACVSPLAAGRPCPRPQTPIARSPEQVRRLAALGMRGAFAYFEPQPLTSASAADSDRGR